MDGWNRITLVLRPHAAVPPAASDGPGADSDGRDFEVAGPESPGLHESHCSRRKKCREIACSLYKKPPPISIEFSADGFGLTQEWELSKASAAVPIHQADTTATRICSRSRAGIWRYSHERRMWRTAIVMDGCKRGQIVTLSADPDYRAHSITAAGPLHQYPIEGAARREAVFVSHALRTLAWGESIR